MLYQLSYPPAVWWREPDSNRRQNDPKYFFSTTPEYFNKIIMNEQQANSDCKN
ncbi:MAG: hypothetical protein WDM78_12340 [Puia sp.]